MKTIGLIGGLSWQSSLEYYRIINEIVRERLGGLHSARIVMHSFDLAEMAALQEEADWETVARSIISAAQKLEAAGANVLVICTNTMHKVAEEVQRDIRIPLLHIADVTAEAVKASGLKKVGLLGTKFTMEEDFWKGRLIEHYDLDVIVPGQNERQIVDRIVYDELCIGQVKSSSQETLHTIIRNLAAAGAQGIILGCTEIYLLCRGLPARDSRAGRPRHVQVPVFDTTKIHAESAARFALE